MLDRIRALYESYVEEFGHLEENRRAGAGMFGLTNGPRNYPCHEQFGKNLERLLQEGEPVAPEQAEQILDYIYFAPQARNKTQDAVYWMMVAVHSLTEGLILRLTPDAANRLLAHYRDAYPRRSLLPAQKKILSALKKQAERSGS